MRLSVPSWLQRGGWLENLRVAETLGWAEGVELLVFSFEGEDRGLFLSELPGLAEAGRRLSLSVHLPDPLLPAHGELVEATRGFVESYVVHPPRVEAGAPGLEAWVGLLGAWRRRWGDDFLLERTEAAPFAAADAALPDLPLCADTGRLLLEGESPAAWLSARAARVREIHLHGVEGGRDHRPFRGDEAWLVALRPLLEAYSGRIELELFSLDHVKAAAAALEIRS
jgi:hypothetical protein